MNVKIKESVIFGPTRPFVFIGGPCAIEGRDMAMLHAEAITSITRKLHIPYIFKSSFDKANRSSLGSGRGVGLEEGLKILEEIRKQFDVPVTTDVHETSQCQSVGEVVDVLQIPAFLSRQTDLLRAAGKTGKGVLVKKGQFLAPEDMVFAVDKIRELGNSKVLVCERGTSFGYHTLINDFRGLAVMAKTSEQPVVFDATHSVQCPGGGSVSGGQRQYVPLLARAAMAVGVSGLFAEVHADPEHAISDAAVQLRLSMLEKFLKEVQEADNWSKKHLWSEGEWQ